MLLESDTPISGAEFAKIFNVTRQIIVNDMALIRAEKNDIISTARGYLIKKDIGRAEKTTIKVCHSEKEIEDELQTVIDLGGKVLTTFVDHPYYGTLGETLNIKSRKDIGVFLDKLTDSGCEPLLKLTRGVHKHTIEAENEEILAEIIEALKQKGYLIF